MGREWIHSIKGVVSTPHQLLRCQSLDGMYTIDMKGDIKRNHRCFNLGSRGKVKRLSEEQLKCLEKGKAREEEEILKDTDEQQLKGYLPAYLRKIEDEVDEPGTIIEGLEEISLDENDLDKNVQVDALLTKEKKNKLMHFLRRTTYDR